ncbi:GNAT family N-acetyltransferase [Terasakiella pusilla]|uniref:GNAT family N-acetyltransferase n=1 Tax=Terasakiella pusilla TaxID=64973 RepID=UPI003AA7BE68
MNQDFNTKIESVSAKDIACIAKQIIAMDEDYYRAIHPNLSQVTECVTAILRNPQSDLGQIKILMHRDEVVAFYIAYAISQKILRITTSLKTINGYLSGNAPQFEIFRSASRRFSNELSATAKEGYYLNKISVLPKFQGKGFGKLILNAYLKDCDEQGLPALLHVQRKNRLAIELYAKAGFTFKDTGQTYLYAERQI